MPTCNRDANGGAGYCNAHYLRLVTTGDVRADVPIRERRTKQQSKAERCSVKRCKRTPVSKGLCAAHRHRQHRFGDPLAHIPIGAYATWRERRMLG